MGEGRYKTQTDELLNDSKGAAFGMYRPEIRGMPMPKTYKEAKKSYGHGA